MKVPISWLKDYVEFDATPQEIADKLTFSGIEVEGIEVIGAGCEDVVVGEVLAMGPHPNADRLRLCTVNNGTEEFPVVCGADNFEVGDRVAFAGVGVTLPNGMKLKKAKIRGEISMGMMCAEDELGLSDDHAGIMILPSDAVPGTPLCDVIGPPETVLELEITWNRPDCLSIIGIARELAALFGSSLKLPEIALKESSRSVDEYVRVQIDDAQGCPRYTARALTDVAIVSSPDWMQKRLRLCGIRPISNIVDVTNYVMLECGHPLHAFDHALLNEQTIIVRRAADGEKTTTLDDAEHVLGPDVLVIADATKPVAVAGIMGGAGSEIGASTETVLLESACFDPSSIRATSSALKLSSESSHRFERGVDVTSVDWAGNRAAALMQELSGASIARGMVDAYPRKREPLRIELDYGRMASLLGTAVSPAETTRILTSLMIPVVEQNDDGCVVDVPSFRLDLTREADLIEEVARIHGLDQLPSRAPHAVVVPDADDSDARAAYACRVRLAGLGLTEAVHYSFLSEKQLDLFREDDKDARVLLPNPVSADYAVMRNSLVPQMVETLGRNLSRQVSEVAFFEIGTTYHKRPDARIEEEQTLCIGLLGPVGRSGMDKRRAVSPDEMFQWTKGIVESLAKSQHMDVGFDETDHPSFEDSRGLSVRIGGSVVGVMGLLSARIRQNWRMSDPVGVVEMSLQPLLNRGELPALSPLPQYPGVNRDVALVLDAGVTHADILKVIQANAPDELTRVDLFDIFQGEGVGDGRKSMAYSLLYRSLERTLTDDEVNRLHDKVQRALTAELGAEIRRS